MYLDSRHGIFFVRGAVTKIQICYIYYVRETTKWKSSYHMLPHVHDMFMTCSQHLYDMFTTYSQHVLKMFTKCSQHVMNMSWKCNEHVMNMVSRDIMHNLPTFWARSNGYEFESLRPLQGRHGGLHVSRFQARHGATPTLKPYVKHFQSSAIINKDRLLI